MAMTTHVDTDYPPLSPQILTPDTDSQHVEYPSIRTLDKKNGAVSTDAHSQPPPISLLTALLQQTSEHRPPYSSGQNPSSAGVTSAQSSVPSTAFSSPRNPPHGILQQGHISDGQTGTILQRRRSSAESDVIAKDGAVGLGFGGLDGQNGLQSVEERRERIEWADRVDDRAAAREGKPSCLKFAVAHPDSRSSSPIRPAARDKRPESSSSRDDEDTDEGYQEDEEDGFDSESDDGGEDDLRFPFARPTNFDKDRFIGSTMIPVTSPTPAPALLPPPSRRGRGHIRVDEPITSPNEQQSKSCSRHRSPPPTPSRHSDASDDGERRQSNHRLSDAGPRDGRAGSPMPRRLSSESDDELEEDDEDDPLKGPPSATDMKGWRSDDAVFYGAKARQVIPIAPFRQRRRSTGQEESTAVFADSDEDENVDVMDAQGGNAGLPGLLRRASEHISGFTKPAATLPVRCSTAVLAASRPSFSVPLPSQAPCPPALDDTPAIASGITVVDYGDQTGPLAHRLEATLNVPSE